MASRLAVALDRHRSEALRGFAELLQDVGAPDDEAFSKIVSAAFDFGLPRPDVADAFGVNLSTVQRWAAGKNAPHPMARPLIVDWIRLWARAAAKVRPVQIN